RGRSHSGSQSYPDYVDLRDRNRSFEDLAALDVDDVGLDAGEGPFHAWVGEVSGNFFDALGIQPYLGRFFHASDEHGPDSAPYLVLTYAHWHVHFHDDPTVVGRTVLVNKHPFTIVGIAPPGFRGPVVIFPLDFFVPIVDQQEIAGSDALDKRGDRSITMVLGHLKPGLSAVQAI